MSRADRLFDAENRTSTTPRPRTLHHLFHRPPEPEEIEAARKISRNHFSPASCEHLTFSSSVKRALDPPDALPHAKTEDHHIRNLISRPTLQEAREQRSEPDYDALDFHSLPSPTFAPKGYDQIHLRNEIHHDIAFAVHKQNAAETFIKEHPQLVIEYSVTDAYLITVFDYLRKPPDNPTSREGKCSNMSYEVYHDYRNPEDVVTQYAEVPNQTRSSENSEDHVQEIEVVQNVYKRPYYVRHVDDLAFIKAYEELTTSKSMMWYVTDLRKDQAVWIMIFFYDTVRPGGKLDFDMEMKWVDLPHHSDLTGVRRQEALDAHERYAMEREMKKHAEAARAKQRQAAEQATLAQAGAGEAQSVPPTTAAPMPTTQVEEGPAQLVAPPQVGETPITTVATTPGPSVHHDDAEQAPDASSAPNEDWHLDLVAAAFRAQMQ